MPLGHLKTAAAIGLICASAATATTTIAFAKSPPAQAEKKALAKEPIKVSQDIHKVMRDVRSARNDMYVPFDVGLALSRTFVATPKNAGHIKKASEHLKKGERHKAIVVLKLANIDISFTTASLPVKLADSRIKDAAKLIDSGKYYEANLVLKALEDSVVIDNVMADATPQK
jgi:hypothetical protein